jgi:23S rRNA (adenine2503-C2)-methyltransferase
MVGEPIDILGLTLDELTCAAKQRMPRGFGAARPIYLQAILDGRFAPEEHGLGAQAVAAWREHFTLRLPEVVRQGEERDDLGRATTKVVLRSPDGLLYESVRIPMGGREHGEGDPGQPKATLCLSSQVGCKMGCSFCETGRMGLLRDLTAAEIVGQLVLARAVLRWSIQNLVFMGMGEALDNADQLIQALRVLNDKRGLHVSQQKITVCTVGHAEGIRKLRALGWKRLNLSVSLNAPNDTARSALMPFNKKVPLDALIAALAEYPQRSCFVLAVNYCLLPGINDRREDAAGVADFCRRVGRSVVNLIPYNPGSRPIARAPSEEEIARFIGWLDQERIPVRRRITRGRSVMAACGQLGDPSLRSAAPRARDNQGRGG